jgi:hypothetical protein
MNFTHQSSMIYDAVKKGLWIFLGWTHQSLPSTLALYRLPFMVYKELFDDWFAVPRINAVSRLFKV